MKVLAIVLATIFAGALPAYCKPLTCEALKARLTTKFLSDKELETKPDFASAKDDLPAVTVTTIKGSSIDDGYILCKKTDKTPVEINISYRILDLALPSKSKTAQYVLADVVCALTKAETSDCDSVVLEITKAAIEGGSAGVHLAPDNWYLSVDKSHDNLKYQFEPGPVTDIDPPDLSLSK